MSVLSNLLERAFENKGGKNHYQAGPWSIGFEERAFETLFWLYKDKVEVAQGNTFDKEFSLSTNHDDNMLILKELKKALPEYTCLDPHLDAVNPEWFMTDDDCLQHCRVMDADDGVFDFVQINGTPDEDKFTVSHFEVDLGDYSEEKMQSALDSYGYGNLREFEHEYGKDAPRLMAEMLFEIEYGTYTIEAYYDVSWNEAVTQVQDITKLDLSEYKEVCEKKLPLDLQISDVNETKAQQLLSQPEMVRGNKDNER